ncbi:hypothetical protein QTP70_021044, partial [Hemibagrus guttatus]
AEAEEKYEQATESVDQLQKQNADLMSQVDTLQYTLQELGNLLAETRTECIDTKMLYETELNLRKHVQFEYKQKDDKINQEISSLRVTLIEAKRKYEDAMETNAHLESSNSRLWSDVRLMQDAMLELDKELSLTRIQCNEIKRECELKKHELNNLQSEQNESEDTSLKESEREKEAHSVLMFDQMSSTHYEELLQGIQAKAKRLSREVTHDHLKRDEDELKSEVNKLRESVQQLERELSESRSKCEEIKKECEREKEAHSILKGDKMISTYSEELLEVSQPEAEEKYESVAQLENENSDLKSQVKTLQDTVQGLSDVLTETRSKCEKAKQEHEVAQGILELVETRAKQRERYLILTNTGIQESLDEAVRKYRVAMERNTWLENEIVDMVTEMHSLDEQVSNLSHELSESQWSLAVTTMDLEQKQHQLTQLDAKWEMLNETVLKDYEVEGLAHGNLKVQYCEMKEQHDKLQEDYEKECLAHRDLKEQHNNLQEDHEQAREAYSIQQSQYEELKQRYESLMECVREQKAHRVLNVQYDEMKEPPSHTEESVSKGYKAGCFFQIPLGEETYEPAMGSSALQNSEKSDPTSQVNRQQRSVQQLEEELAATSRKCDEITREREREREEYNLLKLRYQEMEEILQECEELLNDYRKGLGSEDPTAP